MKITVFSVNVTSKTSMAGKPYQNAEIAFKNLETGKVESKNLTQYSAVFPKVAEAKEGGVYEVATSKDAKGFWQWDTFTPSTFEPSSIPVPAPTGKPGFAAPKSTYETPEERAKKQVYIVKQSSIGSAIEILSVGAKNPPSVEQVLVVAQQLTDWVFAEKKADLFAEQGDLFEGEVE